MAVWTKMIKEDRTMRNNTNTLKHLFAALLTIAALAAGHTTAWAQEEIAGLTYNSEGGYYEIPDADALDAFAYYLAHTANGSGKTFKLTGDITYTHGNSDTEHNFTPIGNSFRGTLDGQGHAISGIRVYQPNDTYIGVFKEINSCTVKNIVLNDARITGYSYVGGITGKITSSTVQNCLVLNSVIIHTQSPGSGKGAISGDYSNTTSCSNNIYYNCTVNGTDYWIGSYSGDQDWAYRGHTITLPAGVSATSDKSLTYSGITYYGIRSNTVTLTYDNLPDGKAPLFTVTKTEDSNLVAVTSDSFTMPAANVNVSVELRDCHTLSLPAGITATGTTITLGLEERYLAGTTVTLSYPALSDGYEVVYSVNGTPITGSTFEISANSTVTFTTNDVWGIGSGSDGTSEATAYVISTAAGLDLLAKRVDGTDGYSQNDYENMFFKLGADISYTHATDWNATASNENNYAPIGHINPFKGTFDGQGHTISGIRIFRGNTYDADSYLGIFGTVTEGTVKNITVSDTRITGYDYVGGIVAYNYEGTVSNCHVTNTVAIHAVINGAERHGGIVGYNYGEFNDFLVTGCTSAATLSVADGLTSFENVGGIVGYDYGGLMENCLAIGANVSGSERVGALVGTSYYPYFSKNYYKNCTVNGTPNATNVGCGWDEFNTQSGDLDEARGIGRINLLLNATVSGGSTVTVDAVTHYYSGDYDEITLGHGEAPAGYSSFTGYIVKDASDNDITVYENAGVYTFYMHACDVTVTAQWTANPELEITSISATLFGEAQYVTTFYNGTLDYQLPEGAKAYTASLDGAKVVFHQVGVDGNVIPRGTAVIVVADAASVTLTKLASTEVTAYAGNILQGSDTAVTVTAGKVDGKTPYVLGIDNSTLGFYKFSGDTIPAGKAYYLVTE